MYATLELTLGKRFRWRLLLAVSRGSTRYDTCVDTMWSYQTEAIASAAAFRTAKRLGLEVMPDAIYLAEVEM